MKDKPKLDPIMGQPGAKVVTTDGHKSGMRIVPAGVKSQIFGVSGDQIKIQYRSMYYWVPRSKTKLVIEGAATGEKQPASEPNNDHSTGGDFTASILPASKAQKTVEESVTIASIKEGAQGEAEIVTPTEEIPIKKKYSKRKQDTN